MQRLRKSPITEKKRIYLHIVTIIVIAVLSSYSAFAEQAPNARYDKILKRMVEAINR